MSTPSTTELECRRRHPSMRAGVSARRLQTRVSEALGRGGMANAEVAAAVLAVRGQSGLGPAEFASRLGVTVEDLAAAEAGERGRDELPGALRRLVPAGV